MNNYALAFISAVWGVGTGLIVSLVCLNSASDFKKSKIEEPGWLSAVGVFGFITMVFSFGVVVTLLFVAWK